MSGVIAYLSQGRLFIKYAESQPQAIESEFARAARDRMAKRLASDGWKSRSGVWGAMGMTPPNQNQWEEADAGDSPRATTFSSLARGATVGELFYVLDLQGAYGLFRYDWIQQREWRLVHRNAFPLAHLACRSGEMAASVRHPDLTSRIAFSVNEGKFWNSIAGGDSVDAAPSWIPNSRRVLFHSAPVGRNQHGGWMGLAASTIESIDLDHEKEVREVLSEDGWDLLQPKQDDAGNLYFIRRPYRVAGHGAPTLWESIRDLLLIPFRLFMAVFWFFNFLSVMFSGQPLTTTAGQPQRSASQSRWLTLWGHAIDTRTALRRRRGKDTPTLVPADWTLVRRDAQGTTETVAEHVVAYDLTEQGQVIYSTGFAVFELQPGGAPREVLRADHIEQVVWLPAPPPATS